MVKACLSMPVATDLHDIPSAKIRYIFQSWAKLKADILAIWQDYTTFVGNYT